MHHKMTGGIDRRRIFSNVFKESEEKFSKKYKLIRLSYDFEEVAERVSSLFERDRDHINGTGRQRHRVHTRDMLCCCGAIELGIPMAELAKRLGITLVAVSYTLKGGDAISKKRNYLLEN